MKSRRFLPFVHKIFCHIFTVVVGYLFAIILALFSEVLHRKWMSILSLFCFLPWILRYYEKHLKGINKKDLIWDISTSIFALIPLFSLSFYPFKESTNIMFTSIVIFLIPVCLMKNHLAALLYKMNTDDLTIPKDSKPLQLFTIIITIVMSTLISDFTTYCETHFVDFTTWLLKGDYYDSLKEFFSQPDRFLFLFFFILCLPYGRKFLKILLNIAYLLIEYVKRGVPSENKPEDKEN